MIKKLTGFLSLLLAVSLSSCLDTEEKIEIYKNNSGLYTVTIDMSKMLKLMAQMGQNSKDDSNMPEKRDSTVYFKPFTDTSQSLTAREKELFEEGSLRIRVDEPENAMMIMLRFPFKKIEDLPELKSSYFNTIDKLGISNKLKNKEDSTAGEAIPGDMVKDNNFLNPSQDAYQFSAVAGKITNILVSSDDFNVRIQQDSSLQMLQQLTMMMGDMNYKTVISVPGKIKKFTGNQGVLSKDKKSVSFQTTLSDVLNRPEAAAYSVEY